MRRSVFPLDEVVHQQLTAMDDSKCKVLDVREFLSSKGLKLVHLNVRSLLPKVDVMRHALRSDDMTNWH